MDPKLRVIDFFCGAGGFSEGFRQEGYEIVMGIDSWKPAINTFNYNFGLKCQPKNILDFENSIDEIDHLPNTEIIVGSPPCVTFSSSNNSGKADKTLGIRLTNIFLKIIVVKKFQKKSILRAWFMENVVNSLSYIKQEYTFDDLGLNSWARQQGLNPKHIAISLSGKQFIINAADYGTPQIRKRALSGEFVKEGLFSRPTITNFFDSGGTTSPYISLGYILNSLPKPNVKPKGKIFDPLYPNIRIDANLLSDHFYDTGLYECDWKQSKYLKTNHPYMGRMSFPEDRNRPSRTITATKIGASREAIIYKSEISRKGNGEFRLPTVRESATLMGFPITYQFMGGEGAKYKLVGNAVCPPVSRAFASKARQLFNLARIETPKVYVTPDVKGVPNLNSYSTKAFTTPPKRLKNARFRRHPIKDGNMTVTLSNYDVRRDGLGGGKWRTSIQYGSGAGFPSKNLRDGFYKKIEKFIMQQTGGDEFLKIINNGYSEKIGDGQQLQRLFESHSYPKNGFQNPVDLIDALGTIIRSLNIDGIKVCTTNYRILGQKKLIHISQLFALYGINRISTIANRRRGHGSRA